MTEIQNYKHEHDLKERIFQFYVLVVEFRRIRKKSQNRHAGLDPASRTCWNHWIPAFTGMTKKVNSRLFTSSSNLILETWERYSFNFK